MDRVVRELLDEHGRAARVASDDRAGWLRDRGAGRASRRRVGGRGRGGQDKDGERVRGQGAEAPGEDGTGRTVATVGATGGGDWRSREGAELLGPGRRRRRRRRHAVLRRRQDALVGRLPRHAVLLRA